MVDPIGIEYADDWLRAQSFPKQRAFAYKTAVRVLPLIWDRPPNSKLILTALRAALTASVSVEGMDEEVAKSIKIAALHASETSIRTNQRAYAATKSAQSAAAVLRYSSINPSIPALKSLQYASRALMPMSAAVQGLLYEPRLQTDNGTVWQGMEPKEVSSAYYALCDYLAQRDHWSFWKRWLERAWEGERYDDSVTVSVALIEEKAWKQGVRAVARAINELEQGHLPVRFVFEEDLLRNEEAARLPLEPAKRVIAFTQSYAPALSRRDSAPEFSLPQQGAAEHHLLDEIRQSLTRVVDRVVRPDRPNALREDSLEIEIIRSALELPNSQDWVMALELIDARRSLELHLEDGTYPPDSSTDMLRARLAHHVDELGRANDRVAEKIAGYDGLPQPSAPTQDTIAELIEAASKFEDNLDPELKEAFVALAETLKAGQEPPKGVLAVLTNWWTTVGMYLDGAKKDEARVSWLVKMILKLWDLWPGGGA